MKIHAKTLLAATTVGAALAVGSADAAPLFYESFEGESVGAFDGVAGETWSTVAGAISSQDLSYSGGTVAIDSGSRSLSIVGPLGSTNHLLGAGFAQQTGDVYFSFLTTTTTGGIFTNVYISDTPNTNLAGGFAFDTRTLEGVSVDTVKGRSSPVSGANDTADIADLTNSVLFVVGKISKSGVGNYDTLEVLVNPTTDTEPVVWTATQIVDLDTNNLDTLGVRIVEFDNTENFFIDEIRIGTTYGDVVPEPGSLALLGLGGLCLINRRRRS